MSDSIQQLYCTHCTYGTSALHRRDGATKDQAFEYSARAASVERMKSHDTFRLVEPYMYFHLPGDTPAEDLLNETPRSAPCRLIFLPAVNGLQMLAQIRYRQTDTRGRPGSYFAHVLFREHKGNGAAWSAAECLRLWGAADWVIEDSPKLEFDLPPLDSFEAPRGGRPSAIDDRLLRTFLTAPAITPADDPVNVVPPRWRDRPPTERQKLLVTALKGLFEIDLSRREALLIAAEPGLAALLFYGIVRLLPARGLCEKLSFSTFESHTDRPVTALSATTFRDPQKTDLPREAYHSRGFAFNTFNGNCSTFKKRSGKPGYAEAVVKRLVEQGWDDVDALLADFGSRGIGQADELEQMIEVDNLVELFVAPNPAAPLTEAHFPKWSTARDYLRQAVAERVASLGLESREFTALKAAPSHILLLLRLIAGEERVSGVQTVVEALVKSLPGPEISQLVKLPDIAYEYKLTALLHFAKRESRLPPGSEWIWTGSKSGAAAGEAAFLDAILDKLRPQALAQFLKNFLDQTPSEEQARIVAASLLRACEADGAKAAALDVLIRGLPEPAQFALLRTAELRKGLQEYHQGFPDLLGRLFDQLPYQDARFDASLDLLAASKAALRGDHPRRLAAWIDVRRHLKELDALQQAKPSFLARRFGAQREQELERIGGELAAAALEAMPNEAFPDDHLGLHRMQCLSRRIARHLLQSGRLPEGFETRLQNYFGGDTWKIGGDAPVPRTAPQTSTRRRSRSPIRLRTAILAFSLLAVLGGGWWMYTTFIANATPLAEPRTVRKEGAKTKRIGQNDKPAKRPKARTPAPRVAATTKEPGDAEVNVIKPKPDQEPKLPDIVPLGPSQSPLVVPPAVPTGSNDPPPDSPATADGEAIREDYGFPVASDYFALPDLPTSAGEARQQMYAYSPSFELDGEEHLVLRGMRFVNKQIGKSNRGGDDANEAELTAHFSSANRTLRIFLKGGAAETGAANETPLGEFVLEPNAAEPARSVLAFRWNYQNSDALQTVQRWLKLCVLQVEHSDRPTRYVALHGPPRVVASLPLEHERVQIPGYDLPAALSDLDLLLGPGMIDKNRDERFHFGQHGLATRQVVPDLASALQLDEVGLVVDGLAFQLTPQPSLNELARRLKSDLAPLTRDQKALEQRLPMLKNRAKEPQAAQAALSDLFMRKILRQGDLPRGLSGEALFQKVEDVARAKAADLAKQIQELETNYDTAKAGWNDFLKRKPSLSVVLYRFVDGTILSSKPAAGSKGILVKTLIFGQPSPPPAP